MRGHGSQKTPRNNRVQEESLFFHYCSILRRFVSGIVPEPCQRLRFYESVSQVRIAALIEQSADLKRCLEHERIQDP